MKVEYINPFVRAAYSVLETTLGIRPEKGDLSVRTDNATSQQCTIVVGVTGQLVGSVMYGMKLVTADRIASLMLGRPIRTLDASAASAIADLANTISVRALGELAEIGYMCEGAPPSIVRGANVRISGGVERALVIPLMLDDLEIELAVMLEAPHGTQIHGSEGAAKCQNY
jgi:chemotaxis protein CheX